MMTGVQFAAWRYAAKMTQPEAADVFRVNVRTIQNYESSERVPIAFEAATFAWSHGWRPEAAS